MLCGGCPVFHGGGVNPNQKTNAVLYYYYDQHLTSSRTTSESVQHLTTTFDKNIWRHHSTTTFDNNIWQQHLTTSDNIWRHHLTTTSDNNIWRQHLTTSDNIWQHLMALAFKKRTFFVKHCERFCKPELSFLDMLLLFILTVENFLSPIIHCFTLRWHCCNLLFCFAACLFYCRFSREKCKKS